MNKQYIKQWKKYIKNNGFKIKKLPISESWVNFIDEENKNDYIKRIEMVLEEKIKKNIIIFPKPKKILNALYYTGLDEIKVVIIGQDCYHGYELVDNKIKPQAMGLSFSVSKNIKIPSSLNNIYKNLKKFGHIIEIPKSGNLVRWSKQGVLLLNSALTVEHKRPGSHLNLWKKFTNGLIKYIAINSNKVVFILWGKHAESKRYLLEDDDENIINDHLILVSSHPSGYSYTKPLGDNPSFMEQDHFGITNKWLQENGKTKIKW